MKIVRRIDPDFSERAMRRNVRGKNAQNDVKVANLSIGICSADASKRESEDLEARTNILRFRGNEKNKTRRFLSSMRMQIERRSWIIKRNEFFFLSSSSYFFSFPLPSIFFSYLS